MRIKATILLSVLALVSVVWGASSQAKSGTSNLPVARTSDEADAMRVEGERRFRANCGRCHAAPQKFPPRVMGTILQHMRVRATLTAEDRRLILLYMTQ